MVKDILRLIFIVRTEQAGRPTAPSNTRTIQLRIHFRKFHKK